MKTDKIDTLIRDFLHGHMPKEIQRRFRQWMLAPTDREEKEAALRKNWDELLQEPVEADYRHKLPEIHRRIDLLEAGGNRRRSFSLRRWAAVAAMLLLVVSGEYFFLRAKYDQPAMVCLMTAPGSKGEFTLPDGTQIWLNGDSRLSYPESFASNVRRVELDGEAFFKVTHDDAHPFVVDMEVMQVEVLGTEFDACHQRRARYAETILKSGSVKVSSPQLKQSVMLTPNQRLLFDARSCRVDVSNVAAEDYSSWTARQLVFANKSLATILVNLERWYNVQFHYDATVNLAEKLSFRVEYESLEETLRLISRIAPVNYDIRGNDIFLAPNRTTNSN